MSNGPFSIDQINTLYNDHQSIIIQESPNQVPPGRIPRYIEVYLVRDLINCCKPGDEVEVVGVFLCNYDFNMSNTGFPLYKTFFEANNVIKLNIMDIIEISDSE